MFHSFIKDLRISKRLTLRQFCTEMGLDPSNWSKVERGINPPSSDARFLNTLADFFELADSKREEMFDLAAISRREIPADISESILIQTALPAFFRAARGHELSEEQIRMFMDEIKLLHTADKTSESRNLVPA